jgi:hypothetical protein
MKIVTNAAKKKMLVTVPGREESDCDKPVHVQLYADILKSSTFK